MATNVAVMLESEKGVVVRRAAAPDVDLAVDARDRPEKNQGLVDQMRPEVKKHAPALVGSGGLSPGVTA